MSEDEEVVLTVCASHCGGSCLLKVHVRDGVITRNVLGRDEPSVGGSFCYNTCLVEVSKAEA